MNTQKGKPIIIGSTTVTKEFFDNDSRVPHKYEGVVTSRRRIGHNYLYLVRYEDEDTEEMYAYEVRKSMES